MPLRRSIRHRWFLRMATSSILATLSSWHRIQRSSLFGTILQPTTTPAAITVGAGADQFQLMMSEDPFQGDAQFTVSVDGAQIGGTLTTTAVNWQGQQQAFLVKGNFGSGAHTVSVNFLNNAGVLNSQGLAYDAQDRNLYINSITYDDRPVPGTPYELFVNGPHGFSVAAGALPSQETIAASTASSTIALSGATITASSGDHMFFVTGSHDTLSATGGKETVQQYGGNANTIQTGAGNDMISLTGTGELCRRRGRPEPDLRQRHREPHRSTNRRQWLR